MAEMTNEFDRTVRERTLVVCNEFSLFYDECSHGMKNKLVLLVAIDNET